MATPLSDSEFAEAFLQIKERLGESSQGGRCR